MFAKKKLYLGLSKLNQLFQPTYILTLVKPKAHSSDSGCRVTDIEATPKLMELCVS